MAAITWRNIDAPDLRGAGSLFKGAQDSFNQGISGLENVLQQRQVTQNANVDTLRTNNEQTFRDLVASYKTPEALAQAQQSGVFQQQLESFGGAYDKNAVRGVVDQAIDTSRTQVRNALQYDKEKLVNDQLPIVEEIQLRRARGDLTGAQQLIDANPGLLNKGDMAEANDAKRLSLKSETQGDTRFNQGNQSFQNGQTTFGQQQLAYRRGEAIKAKQSELIGAAKSEEDMRKDYVSWANQNDIPVSAQDLQTLGGTFQSTYGLTATQSEGLSAFSAGKQKELERAKADYKFGDVFSFENPEAVNEGKAQQEILTMVPANQEGSEAAVQNAVAEFKKQYPEIDPRISLGSVMLEAAKRGGRTGEDGAWFAMDERITSQKYLNKMKEVYGLALKEATNRETVRGLEDTANSEIAMKKKAYIDTNTFRNQGK